MKPLVITEGSLDKVILANVLKSEPRLRGRYSIEVGGGLSSAISLGRSYLAASDAQVALVLDADTTHPDEIPAKHFEISQLLEAIAPADRFLVLLAVPEIEAVLFQDRALAESIFGRRMTDKEWTMATESPKEALGLLIQGRPTRIINLSKVEQLLGQRDLKPFMRLPLFKALGDFIVRDAA